MHQTIAQKPDTRQGWYVVGICTLAYIFSFIDRQILSLLVGPIKLDLGLTDTSFAFLHGFAFSIFYATLGVPIAGLADRMARPLVIAGALRCGRWQRRPAGWRAAFPSLLARMMVGAGEAALSPAAYALINDLFPREKLGRAIGVYSLGSFLGAGLALLVGGALVAMAGSNSAVMVGAWSLRVWQMCFLVVGLPGLLLAALVWLTVREPAPRKGAGRRAPRPLARRAGLSGARTGDFRAAYAGLCLFGLGPVRDARLGAGGADARLWPERARGGPAARDRCHSGRGRGRFCQWLAARQVREAGPRGHHFSGRHRRGLGRRWPAWRWLWPEARPGARRADRAAILFLVRDHPVERADADGRPRRCARASRRC
jgi:MFS family permease